MVPLAVLGSTGSIGINTLSVIRSLKHKFGVLALSTNSNIDTLRKQIQEFGPEFACVGEINAFLELKKNFRSKTKLLFGTQGLEEIIRDRRLKKIILAISGCAALRPLLTAIDHGKEIAMANKEALVASGPLVVGLLKQKQAKILPVDSEQSAIWQCLEGQDRNKLKNIYLTASGGPLRNKSIKEIRKTKLRDVLRHPRWKMGTKITVDSATMVNKGLELLEAMYLFGIGPDKIKILIHPQAIIHSMVEFIDGVVMAQLSATDMRVPIQYALSYPERINSPLAGLDFYKLRSLTFEKPDFKKFPALGIAYEVAREGGTLPCVFNAANEVCVEEFLKGNLAFYLIPEVIKKVITIHKKIAHPQLEQILAADSWARKLAIKAVAN